MIITEGMFEFTIFFLWNIITCCSSMIVTPSLITIHKKVTIHYLLFFNKLKLNYQGRPAQRSTLICLVMSWSEDKRREMKYSVNMVGVRNCGTGLPILALHDYMLYRQKNPRAYIDFILHLVEQVVGCNNVTLSIF